MKEGSWSEVSPGILGDLHGISQLILDVGTHSHKSIEFLPHQVLAGHGTLLLLNLVPELVVTFITHLID